ncbi:MAG TPA: 50S ribosomal protein L27 [bacterium]|jgi:large subunit ribosomal protein L27|nr:50S ribosomal protein L27 [bacterium]HOG38209.1 50S ribosomal protein L27 [bacterium]HQI03201.1 50S ribosomal protein L27 [bacterium]
MAHKKSGGSTQLGRDSRPKMLGVKMQHGQSVKPGQVIIKQRGTKYHAGKNVRKGADDTLYSSKSGIIQFSKKKVKAFDGNLKLRTFVAVEESKK